MRIDNVVERFSTYMKFIIAYVLTLFCKKNIWIITERGKEARDNGYVFFLYMKKKHPEVQCKYIMDKRNIDYNKLVEYKDDIVQNGSFKHYLIVCKSLYCISTHILTWLPNHGYFYKLNKERNIFKNKYKIFLQHGITKDDIPLLYYESTLLNLFICGAQPEYEYVKEHYHYNEDSIRYTGLCRYDNLNNYITKNQILIMPTWRHYLNPTNFKDSNFFNQYKNLLQSKRLHSLLKKTHCELVFYPHYELQKYINLFKELGLPDFIKIAGDEYDVQTLLKESKLLITDFSSVYFDFSYMKKPVLLFQFDEKEFCESHYKKGYFDVNMISDRSENISDLLDDLEKYILNDYKIPSYINNNIENIFPIRDNHNCDRVYNEILKLQQI